MIRIATLSQRLIWTIYIAAGVTYGRYSFYYCLNRLNFISRIDSQIKHRGYRIELDEIENIILKNIPEIEVAVIYTCEHPNNKTENSEIICFYSPIKEIGEDHIREITLLCLPHYMRPARLIYIRNMPRSPNGKLSRKSLISLLED